jgi:selenocysteine lyase/cysteine desulfurase
MYKKYYKEFLDSHAGKIHLAAHSHHFWPDVAKEGHMESYQKSVELSDNKWGYIFEDLVPDVQGLISEILNFSRPKDISFAPNTHDLVSKLISCFLGQEKINILTTSCEFHSLSRQLKRFSEEEKFNIISLDPESEDFSNELKVQLETQEFDLIIFSQVFFNSGRILNNETIEEIIKLKGKALFVLDAYHGFCAVPFDISIYEDDIFYIAGGYKYAQAGAGVCFMTLPKECKLRPMITGWFASFATLEDDSSKSVAYEDSGMRFWGSTIDFTPFYRFRAVWNFFKDEGLNVDKFDQHIKNLQLEFIKDNPFKKLLTNIDLSKQGHFLTIKMDSPELAKELSSRLATNGVLTDFRGDRLRFGFAPYLNIGEVIQAKQYLSS